MIQIRTCVYTRQKDFKKNLIRLVKNENGYYTIDEKQIIQARGIYIKPCTKVIELINKNKKYNICEADKQRIISIIKAGENIE